MRENRRKRMMKRICLIFFAGILALSAGCKTAGKIDQKADPLAEKNRTFLQKDPRAAEVFRVLLSSEEYTVVQMRNDNTITRAEDQGGDRYMSSEIAKLNKIDEVREGIISLWIYPDSGRVMKIRTQKPTFLIEVDQLLTDDIQRWSFKFPGKTVEPTRFDIRYRVILQKKLSDSEIIKEVQEKMSEGG
jgi:hypothetical protein